VECSKAGLRKLAKEDSVSFVSTQGDPEPAFILQHRALDPGVPAPQTDSPLSVVSDVHISFCPWCGADLKRAYRDNFRELDRSELRVPL
jgi:hypothetical protein